jgi:flagellar hook assembly protein FlgD
VTPTYTDSPTFTKTPKDYVTVRVSVWNEAGEEVGVLSEGMILEEAVEEFYFDQNMSVIASDSPQIAIVFPEDDSRAPITIIWDGSGQSGEPLANGAYVVKVESIDSLGITTVITGSASILRTSATVTVRIYNEAGEQVYSRQQAAGGLRPSDIEILGMVIDPALALGSPGSALNISLGTTNILWTGLDGSGQTLANGEYLLEITLEQAGTTTVITETVTILSSNKSQVASSKLNPNPVAGSSPVEIRVTSAKNAVTRIQVKAYTVSGELLRRLESASDSLLWDLRDTSGSSVSAGLYVLLVEATLADGSTAKSLERLVVLR